MTQYVLVLVSSFVQYLFVLLLQRCRSCEAEADSNRQSAERGGVRDVPAVTDTACTSSTECLCAAQRSSPRSVLHSSLCPALIHLPTCYYRDTEEKNAEAAGRHKCWRPELHPNREREQKEQTELSHKKIYLCWLRNADASFYLEAYELTREHCLNVCLFHAIVSYIN